MSRRKSLAERRERKTRIRRRCRQCNSTDIATKEYPDAWLHICRRCQYPVREMKVPT
jgi:hypothetical protein